MAAGATLARGRSDASAYTAQVDRLEQFRVPIGSIEEQRRAGRMLAASGQRYLDASTGLFAVAGAAALTSIVLAVFTRWRASEATFTVRPGPGGASAGGSF